MCGKPMISCELGTGTSYVNKAGETGLVVPPSDPARLAEAINRFRRFAGRGGEMGPSCA